jgi:hypothetical protein
MPQCEVAENLVLIGGAGRAKVHKQVLDRGAVNARHPHGGAQRIALNQARHDLNLLIGA